MRFRARVPRYASTGDAKEATAANMSKVAFESFIVGLVVDRIVWSCSLFLCDGL